MIETAWCGSVAHRRLADRNNNRRSARIRIVLVVAESGCNRLHAFRADSGEPLATPPETMRGLHRIFRRSSPPKTGSYVAADDTIATHSSF